MTTTEGHRPTQGASAPVRLVSPLGVVLRALAVVDAVAIQGLFLFWIWQWPKHGGFLGAAFSTLLIWWAVKRASRAVFDFGNYRWVARYVIGLMLAAWLLRAVSYLQSVF